jgi:hypothetical protein
MNKTGSNTWRESMDDDEEHALLIFERKIFRRIYGPKFKDEEWKRRTNRELEVLSKGENIVKWINWQRISWLGHLDRMEEDRTPKKIITQELEGTRRRGRSRKGWREEVERDLQVLGVRRWRDLVIDKEKWKGIVRRAKAYSGLERHRKKKKKTFSSDLFSSLRTKRPRRFKPLKKTQEVYVETSDTN